MDEQVTPVGEFIPAEPRDDKPAYNGEDHRIHTRLSLKQTKTEDLSMACDGVTVNLYKPGFLGLNRRAGIANVKDLSIGGLGFLCSSRLELGNALVIRIAGFDLSLKVVRAVPVNSRLSFYGSTWTAESEDRIIELMNRVQRQMKNKQKS